MLKSGQVSHVATQAQGLTFANNLAPLLMVFGPESDPGTLAGKKILPTDQGLSPIKSLPHYFFSGLSYAKPADFDITLR